MGVDMVSRLHDLAEVVRLLRAHHGPPPAPASRDPFELVLLENVAYLAPPLRRREALDQLRETVGLRPEQILAAPARDLERVTAKGILKATFAEKLRTCARIVLEEFEGDLGAALAGPLPTARKALRRFPGIGEPGADKILLFMGRHARLAPESHGLRVLVCLGLVPSAKSYSRMYADSRLAEASLPQEPGAMEEAHLLLHFHGQTLCRSGAPRCDLCPLNTGCAEALAGSLPARGGRP